jgi:hypothetical protein
MPNYSKRIPPAGLHRKLHIRTNLVRLVTMDEESHSTSNVLPPAHASDAPWDSAQFGSDIDNDSSDDSYISYHPSNEEAMEDDDDKDLAAALSWAPTTDKVDASKVGEFLLQAKSSMMKPPAGTTLNEPEEPEYPQYIDGVS